MYSVQIDFWSCPVIYFVWFSSALTSRQVQNYCDLSSHEEQQWVGRNSCRLSLNSVQLTFFFQEMEATHSNAFRLPLLVKAVRCSSIFCCNMSNTTLSPALITTRSSQMMKPQQLTVRRQQAPRRVWCKAWCTKSPAIPSSEAEFLLQMILPLSGVTIQLQYPTMMIHHESLWYFSKTTIFGLITFYFIFKYFYLYRYLIKCLK